MALDVSGGAAVASLEIPLQLTGAGQVTASLANVGAQGEAAAARVGSAFDRARDAQGRFTSGAANLTASLAGAGGAASVAGDGINNFNDRIRRGAADTETHTLATGRLIRAFEGLGVSALGANRELATIAVVAGEFAAGNIAILALVGAVGLAAFAYEKLTGSEREAQKQQDDLTSSLDKWYASQRNGVAGDLVPQIDAVTKAMADLAKTIERTQSLTSRGPILGPLASGLNAGPDITDKLKILGSAIVEGSKAAATTPFGGEFEAFTNAFNTAVDKFTADAKAKLGHMGDELAAAQKEADKKLADQARQDAETFFGNLASSVSAGGPGGGPASQLAANAQQQLDYLRSSAPAASSGQAYRDNLAAQAEQLKILAQLTDALHAAEMHRLDGLNETIAEAEKQRALQDLITVGVVKYSAAVRDGQVVTRDGQIVYESTIATVVRLTDVINAETDALRKAAAANPISSGGAGVGGTAADTAALRNLADTFHITGGPLGDLPKLQADVKATENALNDLTRQGLADYNAGLTKSSELTKQAASDAAHLSDVIGRDLVRAVVDFAAQGSFSFGSFLKDATNDSLRIVGILEQGVAKLKEDIAKGAKDVSDLASAQSQLSLTKNIAAGLGGASLGYSLGQSAGTYSNGLGLGAAAGAAQGAQFGPEGAVIGAFAGAIGGLLGAAEAHKQAAAALQAAGERIQQSLASYAAPSGATALLAQNEATYQTLRKQIQDDFNAAAKNNDRGAAQTAINQAGQLDAEHIANATKIIQDFVNGLTSKLNSLSGPAGNYQNSLDAIAKEYADNVATIEATFGGQDELNKATAIYQKELDQLNATYAETLKQTQLALDARQAEAEGNTRLADTIRRRAAEEQELFDAQQKGYTDAQLAQLKFIQGLEDLAAAQERARQATYTLLQNIASGPGGTAADVAKSDLAPLLDQQAKDTAALAQDQAQLTADLLAGADAATIAADAYNILADNTALAGDAAAIAAKAWSDAVAVLQQSTSDIENAVSGGHITGSAGLAGERGNLGALLGIDPGTITDSLLNSLYADPTQAGGLTNQQRASNAAIDQYFKDEAQWGPKLADAASQLAGSGTSPAFTASTTAIASGAKALTDQTGNRMADYLASELVILKEIRDDQRSFHSPLGSAFTFPTINPIGPTPSFAGQPAAVNGGSSQVEVTINHKIELRGSADAKVAARQVIQEVLAALKDPEVQRAIAKSDNELIGRIIIAKNRNQGNNLVGSSDLGL